MPLPAVLRELAHCAEPEILVRLLDNPRCPPDAVSLIIGRGVHTPGLFDQPAHPGLNRGMPLSLAEQAADHRNLDPAGMRKLARWSVRRPDALAGSPENRIQVRLARRADLDEWAALLLARRGHHFCRALLAEDGHTPPAVLAVLLRDLSTEVAVAAAGNPSLSRSVLAMWQLAHDTT